MNGTLRVFVVDDHALVRAGLRSLLEGLPHVEVVGEAANGRDALENIDQVRPDVVLMDISMPTMNGFEAVRRLVSEHPNVRALMVSMHADEQSVSGAFDAGASGYLLKSAEREELAIALRTVSEGQRWLSRGVRKQLIEAIAGGELPSRPRPVLTPRQREVVQLIAEGSSTREIARQLRISVKTVETHRAQLMDRLDIHDVAGLVMYAIRVGIIRPEG
jgi:DNA-binding NarL/FixJ family response regulator